jgi:miniconductance mechanosensitive channel
MTEPLETDSIVENLQVFFESSLGWGGAASMLSALVLCLGLFLSVVFMVMLVRHHHLQELFLKVARRTPFRWDDWAAKNGLFLWVAHILFSVLFILLSQVIFGSVELLGFPVGTAITTLCYVHLVVAILFFFDSCLNGAQDAYNRLPVSKDIGIKGAIQAVKLILFIAGVIFILSLLLGKSPFYFLSGIGAMTAVLLLIFRDALLGLVAGIQISANRNVRVGDWVEMPTHLADGDVIDISLTTVKIQNWDKTITSIPTYDLISRPFKNWRGMSESGGRRIKRAIMIDLQTIRFADQAMIASFRKISLLRPYLEQKIAEVDQFNRENGIDDIPSNGRCLTNVGTFRAYCEAYLRAHPRIHQGLTFLVRQLEPGPKGLPLEIYVFVNDIAWSNYEKIQSDIFDHLLAILPAFQLSAFQEPSGWDFKALVEHDGTQKRPTSLQG